MLELYKREIEPSEYKPYFAGYIGLTTDKPFGEQVEKQTGIMGDFFEKLNPDILSKSYAEGKWTLGQALGHVSDTERVMSYRALRISRGDKTPLPGFDQDTFANASPCFRYSKNDFLMEYTSVRLGTITLFERMEEEELIRSALVDGHALSTRAIAFIILGHEIHHMNIIKERYLKI